MELGLLLAPGPGALTSMAGRTVRDSIGTTVGILFGGQITGTLTDLTLRAIMGECGFRWREEFLETLGEAQKKATRFGVADLFPLSRLLPVVRSPSGDGRRELTRELAGAAGGGSGLELTEARNNPAR
ncbi:Os01g0181400 [Oryza sativa Japonica Group]|uniref:Uncharacterized protein n=2 Tax=Oryza sativa subsp. japonica TaxID=39947 RepID=A0A8J8XCY7_ORYSJ|nr:hypothetical protein OsJ_00633 [Oryza sativa Japonica Group]BAS70735.1 Os01g0181400 [Oryza sativa Japonica Group]